MRACTNDKFAIVTQVAPPQPSGQSVLLDRLLRNASADSYCLIYSGDEDLGDGALPARTHHIRPLMRFRFPDIRYFSWLTIMFNAFVGIVHRVVRIVQLARSENCGILIGCSGDLLNLPATWLASRWMGIPFVVYILDDYIYQWTGYRRNIAAFFERRFIGDASRVIVLNEFVQQDYADRYGIAPIVLHNPVSLPDLEAIDRAEAPVEGAAINIVYTGSIYHAHFDAFRNLIAVLGRLEDRAINLHIYTSQPFEWLRSHGIEGARVHYHEHISQNEVIAVLRWADILFLPLALHSTIPEVIRSSAPFKTSEYLAIGRPILVHVPPGCFLSWYFRKYNCGAVVDCDDADVLAATLCKLVAEVELRQALSANARNRAKVDFNLEVIRPAFFEILDGVRRTDEFPLVVKHD